MITHSRRNFFALAAGAGLLGGEKLGRAQSPKAHAKTGMTVLSARPEDLEMPLSGFADYITPIEHFFVRTHVYVPTVDIASWKLEVRGEVGNPLSLTMADLRKMPSVELVAVTECAGNGRSFYKPTVPGLQWSNGSVGNGRWRGVRMADVLKRAGIKPSAADIEFDGADVPLGKMPDFHRSIPVKKALDENTLLAYAMNGETLPVKHGFPLRVIAPGWASDSWVKWLTSITVLDKESESFWMKSAYRKPDFPVEPGATVPADKMTPVTSLKVKSLIYHDDIDGIHGVAWSGDGGPVVAVDVSLDSGKTWKPAAFQPGQTAKFGWRQWAFKAPRASRVFIARARDASGAVQPATPEWNPSGYGWNVYSRLEILDDDMRTPVAFPEMKRECMTCHGDDVIKQQHLTRAQWDREITKMTNWGAEVKAEDREGLLDFLSKNFK
jgi:DMSO/TMAO reductase YedYZ molybdopterin-dependent catalytic subunit